MFLSACGFLRASVYSVFVPLERPCERLPSLAAATAAGLCTQTIHAKLFTGRRALYKVSASETERKRVGEREIEKEREGESESSLTGMHSSLASLSGDTISSESLC